MTYFTYEELGAADAPLEVRRNLARLCSDLLDPVRQAIGRPILINSGYRTPEHNLAVGGSPTSDHPRGMAVDLRLTALSGPEIKELLVGAIMRLSLTFDQLIVYPRFVHLSYRPDARNRRMILQRINN